MIKARIKILKENKEPDLKEKSQNIASVEGGRGKFKTEVVVVGKVKTDNMNRYSTVNKKGLLIHVITEI